MASELDSPEEIANERARVREIAGGPVDARRHRWYRRPLQVIGIVVAVMVAIAGIEQMAYANRILPGVHVAGAGVAQKTKTAARDAINDRAAQIEHDAIVATFAGRKLSTSPASIGLRVDADATYADAKDAGRKNQNAAQLLVGPYTRLFAGNDVDWHVTFDDAKVRAVLAGWERNNITGHVPGDVTFEGTKVVPHLPVVGKTVDARAAYAPFVAALRKGARGPIDLPTKPVTPVLHDADVQRVAEQARLVLREPYDIVWNNTHMQITPDQLATGLVTTRKPDGSGLALTIDSAKLAATMGSKAKGFEVAPVDARFVVNGNNTVSVVPSKDGLQLDYKALIGPIVAGQRSIRASFAPLHPAHDTKWAQGLGIKEMVSTFTTMHPCCAPRVTNIHRGADIIQNTVVEPGHRFSLNEAMGQRTLARGFVVAPIYDHGHKDDVGGGVSQLSTTVFNAAWWGGFKIIEHQPHTIWITRYPPGREATLNWGAIDNVFENNSKHGILVHTSYTGTSITVSIYGDREGKTVREENRKVTSGVQAGGQPFTVEFDRVIDQPGQPEKREHYRWHYVTAVP